MRRYSFVFLFLLLYYTHKLNSQPAIEWQKSLGGSEQDYGTVARQTADGGYIVAGYSYSSDGDVTSSRGYADYWIVKLDNSGAIQWQRSLGGNSADVAKSIEQTSDGGYIVAGSSYSNNGDVTGNRGAYDYWIVKLNSTGNIEWQKSLGGTENDEAQSIRQTNDGGYIVAGWSYSSNGNVTGHHPGPKIKGKPQINADYWVVKLNSIGNIQWQRSLGGSYDDRAYSVQQTNDGGFIVAGHSYSNNGDVTGHQGIAGITGASDFWIVKLNNAGNIQFQRSLGGDRKDAAYSVEQTSDGGFIVVGESWSSNGDVSGHHGLTQIISQSCGPTPDYWVVKLNNTGVIQWQRSLGGNAYDIAYSVKQTIDGGYIVAGSTGSNDGDVSGNHGPQSLQFCHAINGFLSDFWVVQLDNAGSIQWQKCIGGGNSDLARSIQQTDDGGFIVIGESVALNSGDVTDNHGGYDYSVVKLGPVTTTPRVQKSIPQNEITDLSFNVYPNPAQKQVNVYFPQRNLYEDVSILLLNAVGQNVKQISISSSVTTIPLTGLASGFYVYQIRGGRKILKTGKLIIE